MGVDAMTQIDAKSAEEYVRAKWLYVLTYVRDLDSYGTDLYEENAALREKMDALEAPLLQSGLPIAPLSERRTLHEASVKHNLIETNLKKIADHATQLPWAECARLAREVLDK